MILSYVTLMLGGVLWGAREYYHKDPSFFQVLFKVKVDSFFGSKAWERKYKDYPYNTRPRNWIVSILPYNDFWHSSWYVIKTLILFGAMLLINSNNNWYDLRGQYLAAIVIATIITMFWSGFTFWLIKVMIKKKLS